MLPELPSRPVDAHKHFCGRVFILAGSSGMMGAGTLVSRAALRSGAGLATWAVPRGMAQIAMLACLEAIVLPLPQTDGVAPSMDGREYIVEASREADAALLGPGLPVAGETGELVRLLIPEIHAPLVVDAGALSAVGRDGVKIFGKRHAPSILTPHPGEMARLVGKTVDEVMADRSGAAGEYARQTGTVVVLKGHGTVVADGETTWVNSTGNPGMATAGAGDVLGGVILALLAQGMAAPDAARLGVYLHGLAGDLAAARLGIHGLIASDIAEALPEAFLKHQAAGASDRLE